MIFLSTLSLRRATGLRLRGLRPQNGFLSTLSLRRATLPQWCCGQTGWHFYPRSPCGERRLRPCHHRHHEGYFYPRSPCGERLFCLACFCSFNRFLSTLSLRRATRPDCLRLRTCDISIHALLAESDLYSQSGCDPRKYFYPRSPCGERPVATTTATIRCYFYPRSPCGERRRCPQWRCLPIAISIHALLAESDLRPPCFRGRQKISIHALLAESDLPWHRPAWISSTFLSTLSLRRATR